MLKFIIMQYIRDKKQAAVWHKYNEYGIKQKKQLVII